MTEQTAVTVRPQDAPVEWGKRGEIGALADRFAVMLPGAKEMTREEVLTAAQYARVMDLNPFRGEVYFYKDRGKLCVVDGYKALARWAKNEMPYTDRYDPLPPDDGELVKMRCWILREDRKEFLREYKEMGATFQEAFEIAATYADGVVMVSETKTRRGDDRTPPTGWTWEQVARKRAFKNAINLSHGAPSPRDIAKQSWEVNGVTTAPADWDGAEVLSQEEVEALAELRARTRETLADFRELPPDERKAKAADNSRALYGDPDFEGFDDEPDNGNGTTPAVSTATDLIDAIKLLEYYKHGKHALNTYNKVTQENLESWPTANDPKFYANALEVLTNYAQEQAALAEQDKAREVIKQTAEQMEAPF